MISIVHNCQLGETNPSHAMACAMAKIVCGVGSTHNSIAYLIDISSFSMPLSLSMKDNAIFFEAT